MSPENTLNIKQRLNKSKTIDMDWQLARFRHLFLSSQVPVKKTMDSSCLSIVQPCLYLSQPYIWM